MLHLCFPQEQLRPERCALNLSRAWADLQKETHQFSGRSDQQIDCCPSHYFAKGEGTMGASLLLEYRIDLSRRCLSSKYVKGIIREPSCHASGRDVCVCRMRTTRSNMSIDVNQERDCTIGRQSSSLHRAVSRSQSAQGVLETSVNLKTDADVEQYGRSRQS